MPASINKTQKRKKRRGRPATGERPQTSVRLDPEMWKSIDAWRDAQDDRPLRSESIRRLLDLALGGKPKH
jgi:hypothetical protein